MRELNSSSSSIVKKQASKGLDQELGYFHLCVYEDHHQFTHDAAGGKGGATGKTGGSLAFQKKKTTSSSSDTSDSEEESDGAQLPLGDTRSPTEQELVEQNQQKCDDDYTVIGKKATTAAGLDKVKTRTTGGFSANSNTSPKCYVIRLFDNRRCTLHYAKYVHHKSSNLGHQQGGGGATTGSSVVSGTTTPGATSTSIAQTGQHQLLTADQYDLDAEILLEKIIASLYYTGSELICTQNNYFGGMNSMTNDIDNGRNTSITNTSSSKSQLYHQNNYQKKDKLQDLETIEIDEATGLFVDGPSRLDGMMGGLGEDFESESLLQDLQPGVLFVVQCSRQMKAHRSYSNGINSGSGILNHGDGQLDDSENWFEKSTRIFEDDLTDILQMATTAGTSKERVLGVHQGKINADTAASSSTATSGPGAALGGATIGTNSNINTSDEILDQAQHQQENNNVPFGDYVLLRGTCFLPEERENRNEDDALSSKSHKIAALKKMKFGVVLYDPLTDGKQLCERVFDLQSIFTEGGGRTPFTREKAALFLEAICYGGPKNGLFLPEGGVGL
ncbi:unnamed protein product [Amoebophrya sp. A120]|nr:unnamed protein product [Amoebophrya sp. A120]|eukprot:GSA120T00014357001.1